MKMCVMMGSANYVRNYDKDDLEQFVSEGTNVIVFDDYDEGDMSFLDELNIEYQVV